MMKLVYIALGVLIFTAGMYLSKLRPLLEDLCSKFSSGETIGVFHGEGERFYDSPTEVVGRWMLVVHEGRNHALRRYTIPDEVSGYSVGADAERDDIVLPIAGVSRRHMLIGCDEEGFYCRDNHSKNGVRMQPHGKRVGIEEDIPIRDGLVLYLGMAKVEFRKNTFDDPEYSEPQREEPMKRRKKAGDSDTKRYTAKERR